jgi:hypothetical protein
MYASRRQQVPYNIDIAAEKVPGQNRTNITKQFCSRKCKIYSIIFQYGRLRKIRSLA